MFIPKKGGQNTRLYQILELETSATEDEIKRAYKKLALKYHPDKNPNQEERFKEISTAYNILSDPEKKEIYDTYGEEGLTFLDNGMFGDGELFKVLPLLENPFWLFCGGFIFFLIFFLLVLFIVLRADKSVDWSWSVVFIPLWILDAIIPFVYCFFSSSLGGRIVGLVQYLTLLTFQILLCIQLESYNLQWSEVFIPVYIFEGINLLKRILRSSYAKYLELFDTNATGALFGIGYIGWLMKRLITPILRIIFIILVILRLNGAANWNWVVCAIPIFVGLAWKLIEKIADNKVIVDATEEPEEKRQKASMLAIFTVLFSLSLSVIFTFVILIALRLDGANYSVAVAFIPIFIVLGLAFCACCCITPCLLCSKGNMGVEEEFGGWEIKRQKYLENGTHQT